MRYITIPYNTEKHDFVKVINELFETEHLEDLHEQLETEYTELFQVSKDSCTIFHDKFYDKYRSGWDEMVNLYESFIANVIAPRYKEDFLYQRFPTFRVHLVGNVAVGVFHNDGEFNHPKGEMNYIIPLTYSMDTASMWLESEPGLKDFEAVYMRVGYLIQFNGNELTHGNKVNDTHRTRVSLDFRVLPFLMYDEENNSESITQKTKFKVGEYYKMFKK